MVKVFTKAAAYEKDTGRWSTRLAPLFAEFAGVPREGRLLDVGCGTGVLVQLLAHATDRLAIVGVDCSGPFIEYARSRFTGPRFSFDVGDAMALPYPDATFDCALSLLVFQFIPQPLRAAQEMRRVTLPGGTLAACNWAQGGNERVEIFWEEAMALDPDAKGHRLQNRPSSRPGGLTEIWSATGLADVKETALEIRTDFTSFDDYWVPLAGGAGPPGLYADKLSPERLEALRQALKKRLLGRREDAPIMLKAIALAVRGTVPS